MFMDELTTIDHRTSLDSRYAKEASRQGPYRYGKDRPDPYQRLADRATPVNVFSAGARADETTRAKKTIDTTAEVE